jgi:hypothetical protein
MESRWVLHSLGLELSHKYRVADLPLRSIGVGIGYLSGEPS